MRLAFQPLNHPRLLHAKNEYEGAFTRAFHDRMGANVGQLRAAHCPGR